MNIKVLHDIIQYKDSSAYVEGYMSKKKRLQELTIKDNFMFGAVMADEDNCKPFLQMVLGVSIERVEARSLRNCY